MALEVPDEARDDPLDFGIGGIGIVKCGRVNSRSSPSSTCWHSCSTHKWLCDPHRENALPTEPPDRPAISMAANSRVQCFLYAPKQHGSCHADQLVVGRDLYLTNNQKKSAMSSTCSGRGIEFRTRTSTPVVRREHLPPCY